MDIKPPDCFIEGCKNGDRKAQAALYQYCKPAFFGMCIRYLKKHEDAEDILIVGFKKILEKIHTYSGKGSFDGWMRRFIVNEALMFLRKKKNDLDFGELEDIDESKFPTDCTNDDDFFERVVQPLLNKMPKGYQTVIYMRVFDGFENKEIAENLGIKEGSVGNQYHRGINWLRKQLDKLGYSGWF